MGELVPIQAKVMRLLVFILIFNSISCELMSNYARYSRDYLGKLKGKSWGFFNNNCKSSCWWPRYSIAYWMTSGSTCPDTIVASDLPKALYDYDVTEVCSNKPGVMCTFCYHPVNEVGVLQNTCEHNPPEICEKYADLKDGKCNCPE